MSGDENHVADYLFTADRFSHSVKNDLSISTSKDIAFSQQCTSAKEVPGTLVDRKPMNQGPAQ